jgi:hypothetical protein
MAKERLRVGAIDRTNGCRDCSAGDENPLFRVHIRSAMCENDFTYPLHEIPP